MCGILRVVMRGCGVRGGRVMREAGEGHWVRGWGRAGWTDGEREGD